MRLARCLILSLFVLVVVSGCRKSAREIAEENAIKRHRQDLLQQADPRPPAALMQGLNFLLDLNKKNQLPGISSNDNRNMSLRMDKPPELKADGRLVLELHLFTEGSPRMNYFYVVAEDTNKNQTQLLKAWRADEWKVVEEFPVQ
jgi:hypothetical protein